MISLQLIKAVNITTLDENPLNASIKILTKQKTSRIILYLQRKLYSHDVF